MIKCQICDRGNLVFTWRSPFLGLDHVCAYCMGAGKIPRTVEDATNILMTEIDEFLNNV